MRQGKNPELSVEARPPQIPDVDPSADGGVRLSVLGRFHLSVAGRVVALRTRKAKALLGYLAVTPDGDASREKLAGILWGGSPDEQARTSLRQCLNEIHRALGSGAGLIAADRQEIRLQRGKVWVDAVALRDLTRATRPGERRDVAALYRGELLDGLGAVDRGFDAWLLEERAYWREMVQRMLDTDLRTDLRAQDTQAALETAQALLRLDPAREDVHRIVMKLLADNGQRTLALRQYEACRQALSMAFSARPSAETERLADFIRHFPTESQSPAADGASPATPEKAQLEDSAATASGWWDTPRPAAIAPVEPRLAVLPFDNLSGDTDIDYFSDGVSEEVLHSVARMPGLQVVGRSSSFQFRGTAKTPANIASELGVTHLLDGSVRRSGARVRVSASLMDCASQTNIWAARYDRDLSDVFALQDEIAGAVAQALQLVFAPASVPRKIDPAAYDLYLRARALAGAPAGNAECLELLEEAVQRSPDFAAALASLAMARAVEARWRLPPEEFAAGRARAIEAANRAIALDPSAGLPFVPLSLLAPTAAYAEREALLQQALALAPWDPEILKHASDFEFAVGRMREGYRLIARAHETDPFNRIIANNFAMALGDIGFLRESDDAFAAARARWPEFDWPVSTPLVRAALLGDWKAAQPLLETARASKDKNMRMSLSAVSLLQDKPEKARETLRGLAEHQLATSGSVELRVVFYTYAIGFPDDAFEILGRASFDHLRTVDGRGADSIFLPGLIFSVVNAPMRRDPRFVDLCAKLGLCEYWAQSDHWPDCVEEVAPYYDFKARARDLANLQPRARS